MSDFLFTLPAESASVDPDVEGVDGAITDHEDRAVARLAQQYRLPKLEAFLRALIGPMHDIELCAWQLYTERFVDTAIGAQLDLIGKVVGQPRLGYVDDEYRRLIRARITANRSDGVTEDLITVTVLVIDDDLADITIEPQYPGAVVVRVSGVPVTDETADILITLLQRTVSGGVRVLFEYSTSPEAETFAFDGGTGLGFGDSTNPLTGGNFAGVV